MKAKHIFLCTFCILMGCKKDQNQTASQPEYMLQADGEKYYLHIGVTGSKNEKASSQGKSRFQAINYSFSEILSQISRLAEFEVVIADTVYIPGRFDVLMYTKDRSPLPYDTLLHALTQTFKLKTVREAVKKTAIQLSVQPVLPKPPVNASYELIVRNGVLTADHPRLSSLVDQFNAHHIGYFVTAQDTVTIAGKIECDLNNPVSVLNCLKEKNILIDTIEVERLRYTLTR